MKFAQKTVYLYFVILMNVQIIAAQETIQDDKVLYISDVYLTKVTSNSYELSIDVVDKLMLYARNKLTNNQCMAIYLDVYHFPEKAGFIIAFQTVSTPKEEYNTVLGMPGFSSGTTSLIKTDSVRFNNATPLCSICKLTKNDCVFLGDIAIYRDNLLTKVFAFSPIINDPFQYSVNLNSRYHGTTRE
ncbi:hypothetical protein [Endozoicomonas numazuensis]|uniref:Uncharacterized protein n=1 Tax=Endozoicomonas numazuensis TaxID=1137799 RepID=A0A081NF56_9GAMM|nr:hypothetical protein [Endozoicomonas numazuensis]KEQ17079.1 hypothetical protein GZ78_14405 [Endozoicomonas numazuensis]